MYNTSQVCLFFLLHDIFLILIQTACWKYPRSSHTLMTGMHGVCAARSSQTFRRKLTNTRRSFIMLTRNCGWKIIHPRQYTGKKMIVPKYDRSKSRYRQQLIFGWTQWRYKKAYNKITRKIIAINDKNANSTKKGNTIKEKVIQKTSMKKTQLTGITFHWKTESWTWMFSSFMISW